jgi:hypothetical protein
VLSKSTEMKRVLKLVGVNSERKNKIKTERLVVQMKSSL